MTRIVMVRHGETDGDSSVRYYGRTDVPLSERGRRQMRALAKRLPGDQYHRVVASPLLRAWESAKILRPEDPPWLEEAFREIDFGSWEGLTADEIEQRDPALYKIWRSGDPSFEFPRGEKRADFRKRVEAGLVRLLESGARNVLLVAHKGVIRTITELLSGTSLPDDQPAVAGLAEVVRLADGSWQIGPRPNVPREFYERALPPAPELVP